MSVLDDIIVGVREDLAEREKAVGLDRLKEQQPSVAGLAEPSPAKTWAPKFIHMSLCGQAQASVDMASCLLHRGVCHRVSEEAGELGRWRMAIHPP